MEWRAVRLQKIALARRAVELPPGTTVGMAIGAEVAPVHPAPIVAGGIRAEMLRGVHLARPSPRGHDTEWRATGQLGDVLVGLLTGGTWGLAGQPCKGFQLPRALAG